MLHGLLVDVLLLPLPTTCIGCLFASQRTTFKEDKKKVKGYESKNVSDKASQVRECRLSPSRFIKNFRSWLLFLVEPLFLVMIGLLRVMMMLGIISAYSARWSTRGHVICMLHPPPTPFFSFWTGMACHVFTTPFHVLVFFQSVLRGRKDRLQAESLDEELYDDDGADLSTDDDLFG